MRDVRSGRQDTVAMKLTPDELACLDAMTAAGRTPPEPPPPLGLGSGILSCEGGGGATTIAMLIRYRRTRLRRG